MRYKVIRTDPGRVQGICNEQDAIGYKLVTAVHNGSRLREPITLIFFNAKAVEE